MRPITEAVVEDPRGSRGDTAVGVREPRRVWERHDVRNLRWSVLTLMVVVALPACIAVQDVPAPAPGGRPVVGPVTTLPPPAVTSGPAPPCTAADLDVGLEGLDFATGNGWGSLRAQNRGTGACTLDGAASLVVEQGGRVLDVAVDHASTSLEPVVATTIRLEPRASASAQLFWRGYRNAADQQTPQVVRVVLADGTVDDVVLGTYVPPAPFDLVDGGTLTVAPWQDEGYGPPPSDGPDDPVTTTRRCAEHELVGGLEGPRHESSSESDANPTATLWVTAVGVQPCVVDARLVLRGQDGEEVGPAPDPRTGAARRDAVLRPGDGVRVVLAWADVGPAVTAPDPDAWSVRTGDDVPVPIVVRPDAAEVRAGARAAGRARRPSSRRAAPSSGSPRGRGSRPHARRRARRLP